MKPWTRGCILLLIFLVSGCAVQPISRGQNTVIEWVDFVKLNEVTYIAAQTELGRELEEDELGEPYATIQFNVSKNVTKSNYQSKNGDAAYLDEETTVYTVKGYSPTFRLAAERDGRIILYESFTIPGATTGADYFDIAGKVEFIGIYSEIDGTTKLAKIENASEVEQLAQMILSSPIRDKEQGDAGMRGNRYFIGFHLKDGTVLRRAYWHDQQIFSRDILVPDEFAEIIQSVLHH